ncbi:O-antigen/teichoic acid export membrane protein [Okibacterium sp. HSC-33S16]|nr:O-antigen/teichoic acid export membrane protein [Okibacterium sp. HSC-33S16]
MYGFVALIGLLFQLIPFADLGLGAAVSTAMARRSSNDGGEDVARETVKSAFRALMLSSIVLLAILTVISAAGAWPDMLGLPDSLAGASRWAILVSLAPFALSLPFGIGQRMLLGDGKNHVVNLVSVMGPVLATLATLVLAFSGAEPLVLAMATPFGVLGVSVTCFVLAFRNVHWKWRTVWEAPQALSTPLDIWHAAAPMMIVMITVPLALQSGRLIVAHMGSPEQLASYSLAAQFYAPTLSLITTAGIALWPSFARLGSQGRALWTKSIGIMAVTGLVAGILFLVLVRPVAWIVSSQQIDVPWDVAAAFAMLLFVTALHQPSAYLLTSPRLLTFQAGSSSAMALAAIPLAIFLTPLVGASGPIWAMVIAVGACQMIPCIIRSSLFLKGHAE